MLKDSDFMDGRDYETYVSLFRNMSNFMKHPNLIIYLDLTPEESLRRICIRNREMEANITIEYLTNLNNAYQNWIEKISYAIPVIKVNWNDFHNVSEMATKIKDEYRTMTNIRNIDFL
jgi:deoxyadenosine kinase